MATKTYSYSWSLSGDYGVEQSTSISSSTIASFVAANIPPYSTINSVKVKIKNVYQKIALGSTKGDWGVYIQSSSGTIGTEVYLSEGSITKSSQTLTSNDIKSYFKSGTSDAGALNGYAGVRVALMATVTRPWYVNGIDIIWDYTPPTHTVTLNANGGTVSPTSLSITGGNTYGTLPTPTRTGYTFNYWSLENGTRIYSTTVVNTSHTLVANWTVNTYTVTWKNADGTVLETDTGVAYGTTPTYNGSTPTKASTAQYDYTFSGWSPSVSAITGATTYTAQFTATKRKYTVSTSAENGSVSGGGTYEYGSSAILTPTPNDGYVFKQWSDGNTDNPRTVTVTGNVTYTAEFESAMPEFTVVQMLYNNKQISKDNKVPAGQSFRLIAGVK
ncbi:MAG: InlB B-repeat-containing protein [Clostridia bacterium]|nr:InlB B-repeat-containing protein [Clostridia bacterium]